MDMSRGGEHVTRHLAVIPGSPESTCVRRVGEEKGQSIVNNYLPAVHRIELDVSTAAVIVRGVFPFILEVRRRSRKYSCAA